MNLAWLPDVLARAGITVKLTPGWLTRSHGEISDAFAVVWHHDASPPGDSPGALDWMMSNWDSASAQCWVDRYGTWHLVGVGVAWHAGRVLPGMPDNFGSIGVETDHTTGEDWPAAQLDSLRKGTAAILTARSRQASSLHFHKTICDPPGRKSDPDGLDLDAERAAVAALMAPVIEVKPAPPQAKPPTDWLDTMDESTFRAILADHEAKVLAGVAKLLDDSPATGEKIANPATGVRQNLGTRVRSTQAAASRIEAEQARQGKDIAAIAKKVGLK